MVEESLDYLPWSWKCAWHLCVLTSSDKDTCPMGSVISEGRGLCPPPKERDICILTPWSQGMNYLEAGPGPVSR